MKKLFINIIKVAILFCSSALLLTTIGVSLTKTHSYWKMDSSINNLILGDSHTECAIDDGLITNTLNMSASADSYFYSYVKLRKLTSENPQIDTVVLGYSYHSFAKDLDEKWLTNTSHMISKYKFYFPLLTYNEMFFLYKINPRAFITANIHLVKGMTISIIKGIVKGNKFQNLGIGRYIKLDRDKLQQDIKKIEQDTSNKIKIEKSIYQKEYLLKISDYCINNNLTLILINTPIHSVLDNSYINEKVYYNKFYKENLSMHKLLNHTKIEIPDYGFGDCAHLNYKGATLYSNILNTLIF